MGTSTSWIAVEGASLDEVAERLGLQRVESPEAAHASERLEYTAALLPGGWALLMHRFQRNGQVAEPEVLAALSERWRTVACDEEDHVMYAATSQWHGGREAWAIVHDSERGVDHLEIRGEPPGGFAAIRDEHVRRAADAAAKGIDVDFTYEIPLVTAKHVVGFRVFEEPEGLEYVQLLGAPLPPRPPNPTVRAPVAAKPWWKFW